MTSEASPSDGAAAHLSRYLEASAARFPQRTAVVDPSGASLTYADLRSQAARIAGYLRARGVRRGDRVGVVLPKGIAAVAAIFGILRAGAAYVPIDWKAPRERGARILADCGVRLAFVDPSASDVASGDAPIEAVVVGASAADAGGAPSGCASWDAVLSFPPLEETDPGSGPDDLAYILYTSGSTGVPKGVTLTHGNATSFVDWCSEIFAPSEHDRFSSHAPFHFDLSVFDLYVSIKHGGCLFLISESIAQNPKALTRFVADQGLTVWYSTPSVLRVMAQFGGMGQVGATSLRLVLFAGEVFPVKHLREVVRLWPTPRYFNLYGPTETNVCTFSQIPTPIPDERTEPFPIGLPCRHCLALVLDGEGRPAASGEEGLLHIAGPPVFQGYWGRPRETEAAFIEREGRRWYNTGDVVREEPGAGYIFRGRRDRMVKRRGHRIELGEIEAGLLTSARLCEAAVVALSDPDAGVKITAFVVPSGDPPPSLIDLKAHSARALPASMSPDAFITLAALPRTSTDKIDYPALSARAKRC